MTNSRLLTIATSISLLVVALAIAIALILHSFHTSDASQADVSPAKPSVPTSTISPVQKELTISDFISALKAKGLSPDKQEQRGEGCGLVGASDCVSLDYYSGSVEVYQFDTSITSGRDALEALEKNGFMGQRCYSNSNIAIDKAFTVPKWEQIRAVFSAL